MKPAHRRAPYPRHATLVRNAANAHPETICWRCHRTLPQHPPHHTGKPATWHAGHTQPANPNPTPWTNTTQPPPPGNWLAPEASTCNITAGNHHRHHTTTNNTGYTWPTP